MTPAEWESICDGCGRCCLNTLEDEDAGKVHCADIGSCPLDGTTCKCRDYRNRSKKIEAAAVRQCGRYQVAAAGPLMPMGRLGLAHGVNRRHGALSESFGNWFREADCPGSARGLRKAGATRPAESGATVHHSSRRCSDGSGGTDTGAERPVALDCDYHRREDQPGTYDYLFVDEAGQVSLGNLGATAGAVKDIVGGTA
jgi:hypothetical protein